MAKKLPWYHRFKDKSRGVGIGQDVQARADFAGGQHVESTLMAYQYLRDSLRINAPGYADQNYFEMSRAYVGAPYLAIHSKSIQASCADIKLYEKDLDDPESEEPLSMYEDCAQLIHHPNPDECFGDILEQISLQHDLTGTALGWMPHDVTDHHDQPEELYVLSTASCLPQPISPQYPNGAYLVQPWYPAGPYAMIPVSQGVGATVPAEQIIRVKTAHPFFRWIGYSTLYAISMQIDSLRMADSSRMNAFKKGIDPTAVMTFDPSLKRPTEADLRRLEDQLRAVYGGPENVGRIFMAPMGADVKKLSNTPAEMAYQEGWEQLVDFTMAACGINKAVAGMTGELNYATLFASIRAFYLFRLNPFLTKVGNVFSRKLLHPFYNRNFYLGLEGKSITDESLQEQQINTMGKLNLAKVGELRKLYKLPKSDRDEEWVGEGMQQGKGKSGQGQGGLEDMLRMSPQERDKQVEKQRPNNSEGKGSQGPRGNGVMRPQDREEQLGKAFEKAFRNGHAKPVYPNGRKSVPVRS